MICLITDKAYHLYGTKLTDICALATSQRVVRDRSAVYNLVYIGVIVVIEYNLFKSKCTQILLTEGIL